MACFDSNGYEATTMSMVVEASGVARATVYGHFSSKEELAAEAARVQLDALIKAAPAMLGAKTLASTLTTFNRRTVTWLRKNASVAEVYMRHIQAQADYSARPEQTRPSLRRALRALFAQAAADEAWPEGCDTEFLADSFALLWFNLCMQWLQSRNDALLEQRLQALVRLFEHPT